MFALAPLLSLALLPALAEPDDSPAADATALTPATAVAEVVDAAAAPAVTLSFPTKDGALYQIQRQTPGQTDQGWENVDVAIRGTGEPVTRLLPAGTYRVVRPDGWALVWRDEFEGTASDGTGLDLSKWGKEENNYGGGNNERQAYRADGKYAFVKDGVLHVAVYRDPHTTSDGKTQPYSSARLRTRGRGEWTFGRVEVRAKMPSGEGIWPAVWMLPTDSPYGGWAAGGEIDIIESRGSAVQETTGALHFGGGWPRNSSVAHAYQFPAKNAAEDFHTYAIEWNADAIRWFVDGKLVQTRTKDDWFSEAARENPSAPFDAPFHLLINVAVDGGFFNGTGQQADRIPPDAFPQTLLVDYVRVYQKEN